MSRRLSPWVVVPACCAVGMVFRPGPWRWPAPLELIESAGPSPAMGEAEVVAYYERASRAFRAAMRATPLEEHDRLIEQQVMLFARLVGHGASAAERRVAERVLRAAMAAEEVRRVQVALRFDLAVLLKRRSEVGPRQPLAESRRLSAEALGHFRRLVADYPETATLAPDRARIERAAIVELERLAVGLEAPDLLGEGLDGLPARLSSDRGRVVLIEVWGYCGVLLQQSYDEERALSARLAGRPFAMIGLGSGRDRPGLEGSLRLVDPPWKTVLFDVDGRDATIAPAWRGSPWPAVYLLDHRGVIRWKRVYERFDAADLDDAVDLLLADCERDRAGRGARRVASTDDR
ncbi:MAG TPA: TlpA disulfide reductase family protein [Isosphaeraceae bacterium]|jgi:hypothetical protein|nr:TlpA disulfide reductase family protein [Isosphaeraceae bacterium]